MEKARKIQAAKLSKTYDMAKQLGSVCEYGGLPAIVEGGTVAAAIGNFGIASPPKDHDRSCPLPRRNGLFGIIATSVQLILSSVQLILSTL